MLEFMAFSSWFCLVTSFLQTTMKYIPIMQIRIMVKRNIRNNGSSGRLTDRGSYVYRAQLKPKAPIANERKIPKSLNGSIFLSRMS